MRTVRVAFIIDDCDEGEGCWGAIAFILWSEVVVVRVLVDRKGRKSF